MIQFLYCTNATKTDATLLRDIEQHQKAGERTILLVPEQETVTVERRMAELLPPAAQLLFEVSNFTRLANRVFRTVGGLGYRYATPATCALLMWRALYETAPLLEQYGKNAAHDMRLTERMLAAIKQFKAYCVTPEAMTEAAEALPAGDPLAQKLKDLALVRAAYEGALYSRFDDAADDVTRATALIASHKELFADLHVYVSSFTDFTAQELRLLLVLMESAASVTIALPLASHEDDGIHLASARASSLQLRRLARQSGKRIFEKSIPEDKPTGALDFLRRDLFDMEKEPAPAGLASNGEITLTVAANPYEEAEHAATLIARAVQNGARYGDFSVVVRDTKNYIGILDAALEKEGIPFYLSEKTDITLRPLVKLILFALRIGRYNWQKEDVVGYLKTGLTGIAQDDVNFFEEYAEVWHIAGEGAFKEPFSMNPDGYTDRTSARATRILEGANRARAAFVPPLLSYLSIFDEAKSASELAEATYRFLLALNVPSTMKARAAASLSLGEHREAGEQARLFDVVVDALEALAHTLGDMPLDLAEFADALSLIFAATDIGTIPTSSDEVMIGSAATLRAAPCKEVIVMGLVDGAFPLAVSDTGLLSDAEKRRLAALGIELSADTARVASDELFYVHRAFSLPREKLHLSYTKAGSDGRALEPSIAISRIRALFPTLPLTDFSAVPAADKIFGRQAAIEHLHEVEDIQKRALTRLLEADSDTRDKLTHLQIPIKDTEASVPPATAATLFTDSSFNPTGLEQFVSCKFAYYCNKILRLRCEPTDTLDAAAVGTFIHYVLENTMVAITGGGKPFAEYTDAEADEIVWGSIAAYREHLILAGGGITPRAEALLTRLSSLARIVVRALVAELGDSDFAPAFFELDLKKEGTASEISLPDGTRMPLSGKADRVDIYRAQDGKVYLRVADYKTGRKSFKREDIKKGYCLQMPLYLFALCKGEHRELAKSLGLPQDTRFYPAGVTYLSTAVGNENTPARVEKTTALANAASRLKREGILPESEELLRAISNSGDPAILGSPQAKRKMMTTEDGFEELFSELAETVTRIGAEMRSGTATAAPAEQDGKTACQFCAYTAVCRAAQKKK